MSLPNVIFSYSSNKAAVTHRRVARNSSWGAVSGFWGRSHQPPEGNRGLGRSRRRQGAWGRSPQRSAIFTIFQQKQPFLGIFRLQFLL